jgi:hypothetical protein
MEVFKEGERVPGGVFLAWLGIRDDGISDPQQIVSPYLQAQVGVQQATRHSRIP